MPFSWSQSVRHYLVAAVLVALATAARLALEPVLGAHFPFLPFFAAIAVAAWRGGPGPGFLAIGLSSLAIDRVFLEPGGPIPIFEVHWRLLLAFSVVGLSAALLRAARRRARASDLEARRVLDEQRADRERLRTTLASIADAVIATDPEGRVTALNPAAERLTGWRAEDAAGQPLDAVLRLIDGADGTPHRLLADDDDEARAIEHNAAPIRDERGAVGGTVIVFRDVTERTRAEDALRESERRFAGFMQHLPGLAWIKDVEGRYVFANAAAERAFQTPRADLYGKTDDAVFPPETAAQFRAHDRQAIESGSGVQVIETLAHDDGVVHYSLVSKFPIPGPDGTPALVGGMAIDVTDRMRMEAALREADRRKDEFLATLAHELRNPLAPIRNALHLMRRTAEDGDAASFEAERAMAERQVAHLARLVDDLMDVARISRGKIELRKEPLELAPVVRRAVEALRSTIEARGHTLKVSLPETPIILEADPTRLEQVLWNLVSNASKYTEPRGRIDLEAERSGESVVIQVRDTGIGIELAMLPRVFEMFTQVDHRSTRAQGGIGIGLGLVKSLVEMHGGTIVAESDGPGTGSAFVVRLPALDGVGAMPSGPSPSARNGSQSQSPSPPRRRRILVVDDNADAAVSLAKLLTRLLGQEVRVAHDGLAALAVADEFRPELILLDIGMPGMDGYEVAGRLRSAPEFAATMLVALTGWGQASDRRKSSAAGFDHHLVKPVDPERLRELLAAPR